MKDGRDPLTATVARIVSRLAVDPDVRDLLRGLAGLILEATEPRDAEPQPHPAEGQGTSGEEPRMPPLPDPGATDLVTGAAADAPIAPWPSPSPSPMDRPPSEPLRPLTLGQGAAAPIEPIEPVGPRREEQDEDRDDRGLEWVPERCRLKAEGVRWTVDRRRRARSGVDAEDLAALDHDLIERAQELPDCYLWANALVADSLGADPVRAGALASAFEVAADAAELLGLVEEGALPDRPLLTEILQAIAEAQSGLRVLVDRAGARFDTDQTALFLGLRRCAERHGVYIPRYMKKTDPADPAGLPALSGRLRSLSSELVEARRQSKGQRKRLNKLRYLSGRIAGGTGGEDDWRSLADTVAALVDAGIPPSSPEIRDHLIPILDDLPELGELPRNFEFVLREVDRYLGGQSRRPEPAGPDDPAPIPEVAEVADLLRGRSVVFLANVANPEAKDALIRAFDLSGIDWIITREHQSIAGFEAHIARPEVALVLLPIRWSSHSFGDVKQFCDRYGTPLVRLRAGYNPNMVAVQILAQCSEMLRNGRDGSGA